MRGRERLFATLGIWVAAAVIMNTLIDRLTRVTADFSGLWENGPQVVFGPDFSDQVWSQWQEAIASADAVRNQVAAQVTNAMSAQLDAQMAPLVLLLLAVLLAAVVSTAVIWRNAHLDAAQPAARAVKTSGKTKRGEAAANRVELVINTLDDTELAELRSRLEAVEDEPTSFEELLLRREENQRRR